MKRKLQVTSYKLQVKRRGFTLIELLVAIFIFSLIIVAIVSVFVSTVTAYGKAKAIKTVKENAEFAMASIAKDVRMGKIENISGCIGGASPNNCLVVTRNRGGKVCYKITPASLTIDDVDGNCTDDDTKALVDLSGTNMTFEGTSGFYSLPTDTTSATKMRGWVEINLDIVPNAGKEMEADKINVQTTVSARDYGWEEL